MTSRDLLHYILMFSSENKMPDIHLNSGHFPVYRNHSGDISFLESLKIGEEEKKIPKLGVDVVKGMIKELVWEEGGFEVWGGNGIGYFLSFWNLR